MKQRTILRSKLTMKIRVLVADDSFFMRKLISNILNSEPDIEVIDTARNGEEALQKLKVSKPDVVTLDLMMPGIGGLETLNQIMNSHPIPVVMLSAHTEKGTKTTLECLNAGSVGFVSKPSGEISVDIEKIKDEIISEIKKASRVSAQKIKSIITRKRIKRFLDASSLVKEKVIVIGSSTGGPPALDLILSELPSNLPASILVVQHIPKLFTKFLAENLDKKCELTVKEAQQGDVLETGKVYVAPGDFHTTLAKIKMNGKMKSIINLTKTPLVNNSRPSIDVTMKSVAQAYGENTVGVVLTGMGEDGAKGINAIKRKHGKTIAQDEATCIIFGIPKKVIENGDADSVVPVFEMSQKIIQLL